MKDINGEEIKQGEVIQWRVWDSDDNTEYTFTGIFRGSHIVYLGGGMDFGAAIGKALSCEEVEEKSQSSDNPGIRICCRQDELAGGIQQICNGVRF